MAEGGSLTDPSDSDGSSECSSLVDDEVRSFRDVNKVNELVDKLQQVVHLAVHNDHQKPIERAADELIKLGQKAPLDFDKFDEENYSPLMRACERKKIHIVEVLLEKGASIVYKGKNSKGINPLHIACSSGNVTVLQLLLTRANELESSVNAKTTKECWTPLMYAVKHGHLEAVKLLLETGTIQLEACTKKKENVLHVAAHRQRLDCMKELHSEVISDHTSLYLATNKKGWNILHYACAGGSVEVVKWLLENVPAVTEVQVLNQRARLNNYTPLLVACEYQKLNVVRYLLREDQGAKDMGVGDLGVDAAASAIDNKTGLHLAAIHDTPDIAHELIVKQCPLDVQDSVGDTALHIARRKASLDVANTLRRAPGGERLAEIENNDGQTPAQIQPEDVIPPEIKRRGPEAMEAYRRALRKGKEKIPRCSLQILGEERVGKTSVLRSLTGKNFIEDLDPTYGIDNELVDTLVDIRPISTTAWKEVKPEDQAQEDDMLLVAGVVGELANQGVPLYQQKQGGKKQHIPEQVTAEELLRRIYVAIAVFKQPPVRVNREPPQYQFIPRHHVATHPVASNPPHLITRAPPLVEFIPVPQPQPIPASIPHPVPPLSSLPKHEERPKRVESHRNPKTPREGAPNLTKRSHPPLSQQTAPAKNPTQDSIVPGALVSRRHHHSVDRMIKAAHPTRKEPTLHLNTYDFAGHKEYRPMHHCFITRRALYLVVFNLQHMVAYLDDKRMGKSSGEKSLEEIRYWVNSIHAHIHISTEEDKRTKRVFLVGTHKAPKDAKHGRSLTDNNLKGVHKELKKIFYDNDKYNRSVNHLCFTGIGQQIFAAVENSLDGEGEREASGITALQKELKDVSKALPFLQEQYPILWLQFERGLLQLREEHCQSKTPPLIKLEEVQEISGIEEPDKTHALHFFHDTGTIVCLKEVSSLFLSKDEKSQLDSLVLLDPKWLIEVMKRVMELKKGDQKYRGEDIRDLEKRGIANASLLGECWEGCYSESAGCSFKQLCLILQAYCLIYPLPLPAAGSPGRCKSDNMRTSSAITQQLPSRSQSEGDAKFSNDSKYLVPCMLPNEPISDNLIKKISTKFCFDFCGFLPAEIFHRLICLMIAKPTAVRGSKEAPEFSATRCRFHNVEGRKWQLEMEPECHRLNISIIPTHDEKVSRKPHSYISLVHHEFLQKICEKSNLQGLTYHGGPLLEKCATPECSWSGVLPFVIYPEPEKPDYSPKVACEKCNHPYDIDCLLKVPEPKKQFPPLSYSHPEQQPQPATILNVHAPHAIVATGDGTTIQIPQAALMIQSQGAPSHVTVPSISHNPESAVGQTQAPVTPLPEARGQSARGSRLLASTDQELSTDSDDVDHHYEITQFLTPIKQDKDVLVDLGRQLGLRYPRLVAMKDSPHFLNDLVFSWLRKDDCVIERRPPTWRNLVTALQNIGQNGIAESITKEECQQ